jgi:NMD protein affecting ribosome stability and mRNA decay
MSTEVIRRKRRKHKLSVTERKRRTKLSVRKSRAKIRANRKEQGLCVECGKVNDRQRKLLCQSCQDKMVERRRQEREHRKELELCPQCGNPVDKEGYITCTACIEKAKLRYERWKTNHGNKLQQAT